MMGSVFAEAILLASLHAKKFQLMNENILLNLSMRQNVLFVFAHV
jgi:hypothetical protein